MTPIDMIVSSFTKTRQLFQTLLIIYENTDNHTDTMIP